MAMLNNRFMLISQYQMLDYVDVDFKGFEP